MAQFPINNGLLQGTLNGTPSGGTVNLASATVTLGTLASPLSKASGGTGSTTWGQVAIFWDQKANSTNGDAITANTWTKVTLNTEHCDTGSAFSVSSSVITVAVGGGGTYRIRSRVPLYGTSSSLSRLRRTNNTATTLAVGSSVYTWNSNYVTPSSEITARVTLSDGDTLELQCWGTTNGNIGYSSAAMTDGEVRIYSRIEFIRE